MSKNDIVIDFVVPWVDDSDPIWRAKKEKYTGITSKVGSEDARYRDWDTLKYWFRGVEKFAPWVRYVYFVTDDQIPEWLNVDNPKLKWVKHTDFIPEEYLPTFNSNAIEWNIHRIPGLAENFVYFNDDVFLIDETKPEDFFIDGLPCDLPNLSALTPNCFFSHTIFNNSCLINRHFNLKNSIAQNKMKWIKCQTLGGIFRVGFYGRKRFLSESVSPHIQLSYKKSNFDKLWEEEYDCIHATCLNKLRDNNDVSSWCVRDWQLLSGDFYPQKRIGRCFHTVSMSHNNDAIDYLRKQKGKTICLNDTEDEKDFELHKKMIIDEFEKLFPEKSSFEK